MLKRRIFASVAPIFGLVKERVASAKAYLDKLEALVNSHGIIVSDVFGADIFVSRHAASDHLTRSSDTGGSGPVRWDDGLEFEPAQRGRPNVIDRSTTAEVATVAAHFDSGGDRDLSDVPAFLPRPRIVPSKDDTISAAGRFYMRRHLPTLLCAGVLLIVWITAGRSGPFSQPSHSAADALAERFSGSSEGMPNLTDDIAHADARLEFAPRFAVFYADLVSKDGVCGDGDDAALGNLQSAASIMIRNLPSGTVLSAGEQITATAWRLKPDQINAVIVNLPADRRGPVQATIETVDDGGAVLGQMAVEIRDAAKDQAPSAANRNKIYRVAGSKNGSSKRRPTIGSGQQLVTKSASKNDTANASTANAATQQIAPPFPFLPGPYSKKPPSGTTVAQQILINLGVMPAAPAPAALTQSN